MDRIASRVNQFYERYPYPSLPIRTERDLVHKLHANVMGKILGTAGLTTAELSGKDILDAGCGTGEKAAYFSYHGARVTAFGLCTASLSKARELAEKFEKLCKPGGTITIGLYNRYGRLGHRAVRTWIGMRAGEDFGKRMDYVERAIYGRKMRSVHEVAYVADKYVHPHESYHTVEEVLEWFRKNDFSYIGAHPRADAGVKAFFTQLKWMVKGNGFFVMSGRKN